MATATATGERARFCSPRVAARILAADFPCLGHEVAAAVRSGADLVHVDVMDPEHLSARAVGPIVCAALRRVTRSPVEVHLMVKPTDEVVSAFARAGADVITFHPEESDHVHRTALRVKEHGCRVGLALSPSTPLAVLDDVLEVVDVVQVLWASAGHDGQRVVPAALLRLRTLRDRIARGGRWVALSVEGGIDADNARELLDAGADTLVVASALCGSVDGAGTIAALKRPPPSRLRLVGGALHDARRPR